jgi:hypothetical protein
MSKTTKWIIGIVVVLVLLQFAMPFLWQLLYPVTGGYGMMGNGYGMPMMRGGGGGMMGGFGHMGFGFGGIFMWLLPLGLLVLIALGIAYLWKKLNEKPVQE